jgi:hypothetical protein
MHRRSVARVAPALFGAGDQCGGAAFHSTYLADRVGSAELVDAAPSYEAGAFASLTLVYTAGYFGIDDTGSLKIVQRFASDGGKPQFTDPAAPNYVTAEASNGAAQELRYDQKSNLRPWDKTLWIRVQRGFLREGDRIAVRLGDRRGGSPGLRMQTFVEPTFEFKVLVDAFATYNFVELARQPSIAIVAGPPAGYKALLPTARRVGQAFTLGLKAEDRWGNPAPAFSGSLSVRSSLPVEGLPERVHLAGGARATAFDGLRVLQPDVLQVEFADAAGRVLCRSNPLRIAAQAPLLPCGPTCTASRKKPSAPTPRAN